MRIRNLVLLAALFAAFPAVAREAAARGGADDPVNHDAGDDNGGSGSGSDDGSGSGSGSGGGGRSDRTRVRSFLVRAPGASDADVHGYVELRVRGDRQRFQVEADRLNPGDAVEVLVADGAAVMVSAGTATVGVTGEAELELDTHDGASLPAGATTVSELAGRAVEVRDAAGGLLLTGTVPSLSGAVPNRRGRVSVVDGTTGVRVRIEMRVRGSDGRQQFRVDVKRAASGATAELWVDDGTGVMVEATEALTNGGGRARSRMDSRRGDAMPLGAADLGTLSGRAFEVRVDGVVVASGVLPVL